MQTVNRSEGQIRMNGAFLRNFPDDQREKLLAGVTERLTAHGIEDQKNGEPVRRRPSRESLGIEGDSLTPFCRAE
jgi:hypothetical protein